MKSVRSVCSDLASFLYFVFQVVFCFLIAFLIASLVTPYILFFYKKGGVFICNCSACISNSTLTVIHIRSFHLMSATHQLCCTKLNSNGNDQSNILLIFIFKNKCLKEILPWAGFESTSPRNQLGVITTTPPGQPCWQHSHRRGDSRGQGVGLPGYFSFKVTR